MVGEQMVRDTEYLEACKLVSKMLRTGEIIAHSTIYDHDRGRVICVETDQGWNPDPFYQDYYEEAFSCYPL